MAWFLLANNNDPLIILLELYRRKNTLKIMKRQLEDTISSLSSHFESNFTRKRKIIFI